MPPFPTPDLLVVPLPCRHTKRPHFVKLAITDTSPSSRQYEDDALLAIPAAVILLLPAHHNWSDEIAIPQNAATERDRSCSKNGRHRVVDLLHDARQLSPHVV